MDTVIHEAKVDTTDHRLNEFCKSIGLDNPVTALVVLDALTNLDNPNSQHALNYVLRTRTEKSNKRFFAAQQAAQQEDEEPENQIDGGAAWNRLNEIADRAVVASPKTNRSKMVRCSDLKAGDLVLFPGSKNDYRKVESAAQFGEISVEIKVSGQSRPFFWNQFAEIRAKTLKR